MDVGDSATQTGSRQVGPRATAPRAGVDGVDGVDGVPHRARPPGLLSAKLSAPRLPSGIVLRHRLHERLTEGLAGRATLVSAGPGWGKTMLVADWAASRPESLPVAWLSLDSHDNDPFLFWSYLLAAIRGTGEVEGGALSTLAVHPPLSASFLRKITVGLAELSRPLVLVLDEFGEITNPEVLAGVADLLRHPLPVRLVLVTRSDPHLHLHRLRVDGELSEVRAADLAFTGVEADELLRQSGVTLSAGQSRSLVDRTEGWAAGLRLAAMFASGPDQVERIEEFAGDNGTVAEYLLEEVLSAVEPDQRRFLLRTSVADRLCAELADVLCEEPGGQRRLEDLARANAFVVALGPGHVWFRYHSLMADLLRYRLLLEDPEMVPVLHRRAAEWFAAKGEALAAVQHAIRGQDWQLAGDLVFKGAAIRVVSAERQALDALLAKIPVGVLSTSVELLLCAALRRFIARDYDGFAIQVGQARAMLRAHGAENRGPVEAFLRVADVILARVKGDIPALITGSREVLRWISEPDQAGAPAAALYEAPMLSQLGMGLLWSARDAEAESALQAAVGASTKAAAELTRINTQGYLGLLELTRGHLRAATTFANDGLERAERQGCSELAQARVIYPVLAEVRLVRNDPAEAQRLLTAGFAAQSDDPDPPPGVALQALQVRLWAATGNVQRARAAMTRLRSSLQDTALPALLNYRLAAAEAELELAAGRPGSTLDCVAKLLDDESVAVDELRVYAARASLALQRFAEADAIARSVVDTTDNPVSAVGAWLVGALAADQQRNDHRALAALNSALAIAQPEDIRRPFLVPPHPRLEPMLGHAIGLTPNESFASLILADLNASAPVKAVPAPVSEPLTDRERMVLSHLATLQTNNEIAVDLFISVNTVKSHARAVYRKLGVANRRQAIRRARELDII